MRTFEPIAVVGRSCLLPGALSPEALWDTVVNGRVQITEAADTEWDPSRHRTTEEFLRYTGTRQGGFVRGFEALPKPGAFSLAEPTLAGLGAVFQWSLYVAARALAQSCRPDDGVLERTGIVLANLSYPTRSLRGWFEECHLADLFPGQRGAARRPDARNRFMSGLPAHLIRQTLGLGGEAFALDAACASGLYAVKLACDSLQEQRADLMLAVGVNGVDPLFLNAGFMAVRAISLSGRSRPFHATADGLVPANGAACVALKRLRDAVRDGDAVLGVLRGIGLSNDGRTGSFLSPARRGQTRCMQSAFDQAGISPSQVALIECHATGTIHGDRTEILSMKEIFHRASPLVIGSLKANLGHTITVAGIAGLIKVLECMAHQTLPPTPNAFPLQPTLLETSCFRVLRQAEPWTSSPRIACVSAFGFGGNNAHLIVEAWHPGRKTAPPPAGKPAKRREVAVVGLAVRMPGIADTAQFLDFLLTGRLDPAAGMARADLSLDRPPFPPKDLEQALGQQLLMLELTARALSGVKLADAARTGVFIGMGIDNEVNRLAFKWRIRDLLPESLARDKRWLDALEAVISRGLTAESLIGNMPNIPANRINNQYDFRGPGFTVSSEECSGDQALALAARAIGRNEIESAVVGAVDFSEEKTHDRAARALGVVGPDQKSCDGGVVLVLKEKTLALEDGDMVLATIGEDGGPAAHAWGNRADSSRIRKFVGHSHAASGLLHIAAAVLLAAHRVAPGKGPDDPPIPDLCPGRPLNYAVVNHSFSGASARTFVTSAPQAGQPAMTLLKLPGFWTYAAQDREGLLAILRDDRPSVSGPCRLAFFAAERDKPRILAKAIARLSRPGVQEGWHPDGFAHFSRPVEGEMAFVYTGAASAYPGMGKSLLLTFPWLAEGIHRKLRRLEFDFDWIYREKDARNKQPYFQLIGASLLCQLHTLFSREVAGLTPQSLIGLSGGETNALFAFDIWRDMDELLKQLASGTGTYDRFLGGRFEAVAQFWGLGPGERVDWENWRLFADVEAVRAAIKREERVYMTIIYSARDCMIGGDRRGCTRVIEEIGKSRAVFLDDAFAIHCPPAGAFAPTWRRLHTRETFPVPGIRVYSNHFGTAVEPTSESLAEALTGQAVDTIDFPRLIRKAWEDGIRIFVEHGPRDSLTTAIGENLKGKPYLAVAWDKFGREASDQAWQTLCTLWCAGVEVDWNALKREKITAGPDAEEHRPLFQFDLHQPAIVLPPVTSPPASGEQRQASTAATEPAALPDPAKTSSRRVPGVPGPEPAGAWQEFHGRLLSRHQAYLKTQQEAFAATLHLIHRGWDTFFVEEDARSATRSPSPVRPPETEGIAAHPGPKLNRAQLELLAAGSISSVLGPAFNALDGYAVQVRMPGPPLLLADRIIGIQGEACGLGKGRIWSQTDVTDDAWYLHHGRMPAGIFVEAGQADLLLVSWLGADLLNRGERAYRLLGCELTYYGGLPKPGDRLNYDIRITGYARQGEVRLFFFENDCRIDGQRRLSVRHGQAGFFTAKELAASGGALWDPGTAPYRETPRLEIPEACTRKQSFGALEVAAYLSGEMAACFGDSHRWTAAHTRTPRSQSGAMNFIGTVTAFDVRGGPAGRGYLRSESDLDPHAWYFQAHFKNDPCMPGTLMAEAGLQLMAFYSVGLGLTCHRDGWRFEPAEDVTFKFVCRGQVVPASRKMTYELFVDEVADGPRPSLTAHLLCSVDGVKAFLCQGMVLKLVPDWPLFTLPELLSAPVRPARRPDAVAQLEGFPFDFRALIHSALGKPSLAFGPRFAAYDHEVRPMRLPGPPYHFMSRVVSLEADFGESAGRPTAEVAYDIPPDAWYFRESGAGHMPFSVLMEVALQPCGWLAAFTHSAELIGTELLFRNLDGSAVVGRPVTPRDRLIRTRTTLLDAFGSKEILIKKFRVTSTVGGETVYEMTTAFGFFPPQAMARQRGLPPSPGMLAAFRCPGSLVMDLGRGSAPPPGAGPPAMPSGRLSMIDRIVYLDPLGGRAGLGVVKAEKEVNPGEWFFKAHFFQDPVQPGSLGIEAILQTLRGFMLCQDLHQGLADVQFEPVVANREIEWHYRGQVTPGNRLITITAEILEQTRDDHGAMVAGAAALWVDGLMIYHVPNIGMRLSAPVMGRNDPE